MQDTITAAAAAHDTGSLGCHDRHARDRRHLSGQSGSTVGTKKRNLSGDRAAVFVRERPLLGGRTHFRTGPAEKDRPEAAGAAARVATDPHVTPRTRQKVARTTTGRWGSRQGRRVPAGPLSFSGAGRTACVNGGDAAEAHGETGQG